MRAKSFTRPKSIIGLVLSLMLLAFASWLLLNRVMVHDYIRAQMFNPSSAIQKLDSAIDLTGYGNRLFYASEPQVDDAATFNKSCQTTEKTSVVLGCYASDRIYIYNVTDSELNGIQEVTAAHEMLHAAYVRLSTSERNRIDELLLNEADKLERGDSAFKARMSVYNNLTAAEKVNELHSVIGTEVANLSPDLETYYGQYFKNRSKIVKYYDNYNGLFTKLQDDATALSSSLETQAMSINARVASYDVDINQLTSDIKIFNAKASDGGFSTQAEFAAARSELLARSKTLEATRASINDAIDKYNEDRTKLNEISTHITELNTSINSSLATVPSVGSE